MHIVKQITLACKQQPFKQLHNTCQVAKDKPVLVLETHNTKQTQQTNGHIIGILIVSFVI